jgi:hypothetical protein
MHKRFVAAFLAISALGAITSEAIALTYNVNRTVGANGSVIGTISTDGFIGAWGTTNHITDWSLTITDAANSTLLTGPLSGNSSQLQFTYLSTTPVMSSSLSAIYFDFSGAGHLLFQETLFSGYNFWCLQVDLVCLNIGSVTEGLNTTTFAAYSTNAGQTGEQIIATRDVAATPLPAALPLFASGLAFLGYASLRRRRRAAAFRRL